MDLSKNYKWKSELKKINVSLRKGKQIKKKTWTQTMEFYFDFFVLF